MGSLGGEPVTEFIPFFILIPIIGAALMMLVGFWLS